MKEKLIHRKRVPSREAKHQIFISSMLVLLGGLGLGLSHIPLPFWMLAWIALVPLLLLWDRTQSLSNKSLIQFAAEIYTAFLIAYAVAFFWPLLHTFSEFHILSRTTVLSFGSLLLVPALFTIPFVASLPYRRAKGRRFGFAVFVTFFLAAELIFTYSGFPWPMLGHTQGSVTPLIQFAELTGVAGISLWVLLMNGLAFAYFVAKRRKARVKAVLATVVLLSVTAGFGLWRKAQIKQTAEYVTVGLVQPAMDDATWTERFGGPRIGRLIALSDSLISAMNAPPIFMIWPEMAIPAPASESRHQYVTEQLQAWTEEREVALLAGALVPERIQGRSSRFYNRAMLYRPYAPPQHYDQVHPLPYKPHVPIAAQSPWLPPAVQSGFLVGSSQQTLLFDDIRIGVLLGFEVLLGDYARRYPHQQADFLAVLTQDGWWGNTPGYRRHLNYLRLRSIETRRSIVQVAMSGSSALLAPDGSVIFKADAHESTARLAAVPVFGGLTFYVRYGNWLGTTALVLSLMLIGWTSLAFAWRFWQSIDGSPDHVETLPGVK